MSQLTDEDRFGIELLKLMLQVAWSEGTTNLREKHLLQGVGRSRSVPEPELRKLLHLLEAGKPLPSPNMAILKPRSDEVLEAVRALIAADGRVAPEEQTMLEKITARLAED
jgi:hypothetical protein